MVEFAVTVTVRSRVGRLHKRGSTDTVDVVVAADDHHRVRDLAAALGQAIGVGSRHDIMLSSVQRVPSSDTPLAALDIRDGDTIELLPVAHDTDRAPFGVERGRGPDRVSRSCGGNLAVAIELIGGPVAGRQIELSGGTYAVEASPTGFDVRPVDVLPIGGQWVEDGSATVELELRHDRTVIARPGCVPTTINGAALTGEQVVAEADVVACGRHRFVVRAPSWRAAGWGGGPGQIRLNRTPSPMSRVTHTFDPFGPVPELPKPRRFGLIAVVAPLVMGIGMFAVTRQTMFLMMVALSPIMLIGSFVEDRRSGRRDARLSVAEFESDIERRRTDYVQALAGERRCRSAAAPDLVEVERRAVFTTTDLWCRGRSDDQVIVRVGIGRSPASFAVEVQSGGDPALREQATEAFEGLDVLDEVPVTVDLVGEPVVAIVGDDAAIDGMVASLVCQLCVHFSPEDLVIAAALGPARSTDWLKWFPHLRPESRPLGVGHLARDETASHSLLSAVQALVDLRCSDPHTAPTQWPRLIVFIDAALRPDRALVDRLVESGPAAGVSVVWLAASHVDVVRHAERGLEIGWRDGHLSGQGWSVEQPFTDAGYVPELLDVDRASRIARSLAPLRDAGSARAATDIPATIGLWDVLGGAPPTPAWVERRWRRADRSVLKGRFGWGVRGPIELDLVAQGPHALIGGTSGAGKSELLQAIVVGLATTHPPDHLNFLFIDYKGGASTQVFDRLPHTVGTVSNLDPALAARALRSLRAELNYRMQVLDGRAKDLDDLARIDPSAPPRLVIMVDEFATLVKEIPEFIAGIVDIAQRGRSLGIHLVLATQRPAGSVNDNILANTNLRIALRCLDRADSSAIIDAPDAAAIPTERRGRLIMRRGPSELVEVQVGYGGTPVDAVADDHIRVGVFDQPADIARYAPMTSSANRSGVSGSVTTADVTQLDVAIAAIAEAGTPAEQRRPWCEPLGDTVSLDALRRRFPDWPTVPGKFVIGLADLPDEQTQAPCVVDLDTEGGLLVFGSSTSGKTQLLCSVAATAPPPTTVVAFDGGSQGLAMLRPLPSVAAVAAADDIEAVTRWIVGLRAEVDRRRQRGVTAGDPHILILVDEWSSLLAAIDDSAPSGAIWSDRLHQLIIDGRSVRVQTIITADRRAAVSSRLQSALGGRLILRHADRSNYLDYGIGTEVAKTLELPPGRGLCDESIVQVGIIGDDPSPDGQRRGIQQIADQVDGDHRWVTTVPLPTSVERRVRASLNDPDLGVADVTGRWVGIEPGRVPIAVAGGVGSGRSTTLATIAASAADAGWKVVLIGTPGSGLADIGPTDLPRGFDPSEIARLCDSIERETADRLLVVIDDVDRLPEESTKALDSLVGRVAIVASVDTRTLTGFSMCALIDELRRTRRMLVLCPGDSGELMQLTGMRVEIRPGVDMVPGRGVLISGAATTLIQVAVPTRSTPRRRGRNPLAIR